MDMDTRLHILAIDNESFNLNIIETLLDGDYKTSVATTGEEGLKKAVASSPDLILLDVCLPGVSGLEVCRQLKSNPATETIPVVFVSACNSEKERLAGYAAGGQDYLCKPFNHQELKAKIDLILAIHQHFKRIRQDVQSATSMAMAAMSSTGELGVALHFLRESFACNCFNSLAQLVLDALSQYGLSGAVQLRTRDCNITQSHDGTVPTLELEIFDLVADTESRIHSFGTRAIFNYGSALILVKNMPLGTPELNGRHRDNLALLTEGTEARAKALQLQLDVNKKQALLWQVIDNMEKTLSDIGSRQEGQLDKQSKLMDGLTEQLEEIFHGLNLMASEEDRVAEAVTAAIQPITDMYKDSLTLSQRIEEIVANVRNVLEAEST
ncbi:hypothetical protein MNBD_GAMMA26-1516 [hydrothermal vent metagenome]|uniref:Response regulatory domain-containing protein n=1 Tax=hydrothermal vent metagenome TaxID=652676 RepID=A0A3B1B2J4_9ZZZZ